MNDIISFFYFYEFILSFIKLIFVFFFFVSDPPPADGYAVIVWLHSGDFLKGNASELNPFQLVFKQKVIVVTVAYRMGIFGFFTSLDGEAPGNFGLMDQAGALFWINQNIKLFGGNENSITLLGHGSGAVSASLHLTSGAWSKDAFARAIIMSGTGFSFLSVRSPLSYAAAVDSVASAFGCYRKPTSDLMGCLRRLDAQLIMDGSPVVDWGPIIDEGLSNTTMPFIPDDPRFLIEKGDAQRLPLLIGFSNMEDSLDVSLSDMLDDGISNEAYESLVGNSILNELSQIEINDTCNSISMATMDALNFVYKPYPPTNDPMLLRNKWIDFCVERNFASPSILLANLNSPHAKTYVYRFDIKPQSMAAIDTLPTWSGVPHGFDLVFLWGLPYWVPLENNTVQWDSADKRVSDIIMTLWANYAKFSDPTKIGVYIKWDQFTIDKQGILIIDRSFNMSDANTINYQAVQFWNDYYPKVINFASQCCNVTNGKSSTLTPTTTTTIGIMAIWSLNFLSVALTSIFHSFLHRINFYKFSAKHTK